MAVAFSSATRADLLPLSALDFASGVFGINPIVPPKADDEEVTLEQEILLHGQFFDQLLTMVPAQYYLKDEDAAEEHWKSKFWKVSTSSNASCTAQFRATRASVLRGMPETPKELCVGGCGRSLRS